LKNIGNVHTIRWDYYPFGLPINHDNTPPQVQNWVNRYLYNGKELQIGSGFLDYGARMYMAEIGRWGVVDPLAEKNNDMSGYVYAVNNPILFTDPFGLDTSSANANVPVNQGDVILFDKGITATQSVDEATITGKRHDDSAGMTLIFPGSFAPILRPGPTTITLPKILPLAIPIAYNTLDAYLKGPSVIEDIAEFLERFGVESEVLRGPETRNSADTTIPKGYSETKEYGRFRTCLGIENIGDRINFVVTKLQRCEQTVFETDRSPMGRNFVFFRFKTKKKIRPSRSHECFTFHSSHWLSMAEFAVQLA
jgi:RHS repeat-associated protein